MSTPDGLPPLRDIIRDLGLTARKSLGQNFLLDFNLTRRIARAAGPLEGATIVEVGPGPGGLTRALLMEGASRVIAIEKDERCLPALADYRSGLSRAARDCRRRRARGRLWRPRCAEPCPHRRQPSLQRRHAAPDRLAQDRALAALVRPAGAHVSARGGAPHRGQARQQGLWPPRRAQPMAHRSAHSADPSGRSLHAAAKGRFVARGVRAEGGSAASLRRLHARAGDGSCLRPAAQDAPLLAPSNHAGRGRAAARAWHRSQAPRRGASDRRFLPHRQCAWRAKARPTGSARNP